MFIRGLFFKGIDGGLPLGRRVYLRACPHSNYIAPMSSDPLVAMP